VSSAGGFEPPPAPTRIGNDNSGAIPRGGRRFPRRCRRHRQLLWSDASTPTILPAFCIDTDNSSGLLHRHRQFLGGLFALSQVKPSRLFSGPEQLSVSIQNAREIVGLDSKHQ
jgi:hypothetical protein